MDLLRDQLLREQSDDVSPGMSQLAAPGESSAGFAETSHEMSPGKLKVRAPGTCLRRHGLPGNLSQKKRNSLSGLCNSLLAFFVNTTSGLAFYRLRGADTPEHHREIQVLGVKQKSRK